MVAIGRGAMAAAMSAKNVGEMIENGNIPPSYKNYGDNIDSIFRDSKRLKHIYSDVNTSITPGSIGLFSYLDRLTFGLKLFMTLNRKFYLKYISQNDVIPLTKEAKEYLESISNLNN